MLAAKRKNLKERGIYAQFKSLVNRKENPVKCKTSPDATFQVKEVNFSASICKFSHYLLLAASTFIANWAGGAEKPQISVK